MSDNLSLFVACREVPDNAKKAILGGRLKGKTDINPLWRIKKLTEMFGPCGVGWKTTDEQYHTEKCESTGEIAVFCTLRLQYVDPETHEWSAPIFGIGGSMLIALESGYTADGKKTKVLYLDDEAYKKANTDAISVACKQFGMGASVYWEQDNTKYTGRNSDQPAPTVTKTQTVPPAPAVDRAAEIQRITTAYQTTRSNIEATIVEAINAGELQNINGNLITMSDSDFIRCMAAVEKRFRGAVGGAA